MFTQTGVVGVDVLAGHELRDQRSFPNSRVSEQDHSILRYLFNLLTLGAITDALTAAAGTLERRSLAGHVAISERKIVGDL